MPKVLSALIKPSLCMRMNTHDYQLERVELLSVSTSQGETWAGELVEASTRINHLLIILVKHAARKRIAKIPVALQIC